MMRNARTVFRMLINCLSRRCSNQQLCCNCIKSFCYLCFLNQELLKNKTFISLFFLFAITLVLAHGIIPHHHFDEECVTKGSYHPAYPVHPDNPVKFPWHCQAYNHVVYTEQQLLNKFKTCTSVIQLDPAFIDIWHTPISFEPGFEIHSLNDGPLTCIPIISLSLLRAPPVLA
jgi:hypothetical protein